jgi:hypothetical protein
VSGRKPLYALSCILALAGALLECDAGREHHRAVAAMAVQNALIQISLENVPAVMTTNVTHLY